MKKNIVLSIAFITIFSMAFSSYAGNPEWKLYKSVSGIQIMYSYQNCNDNFNDLHMENIILKLVNTTTVNYQIQWKLNLWIDNICRTCNVTSNEYKMKLDVPAGETILGECFGGKYAKELAIFSKFLNYTDKSSLTKFELADINVIVK